MTSTNDGKDVKSIQTSAQKGKSHYIELYKSLEARLSEVSEGGERTKYLCEAWRQVHTLCLHSAVSTHSHLLSWLQRHTARTILQTEWQSPKRKEDRARLEAAIDCFIEQCREATVDRDRLPWETLLVARGEWFKKILERPWDHPVLGVLLNPNGAPPTDDQVLEWLKEERGVTFVMRLHTLVAEKCDDIAVSLAAAVMQRVRNSTVVVPDLLQSEETKDKPKASPVSSFGDRLATEAGFTTDVWELLTDIEFVLLHKRDSSRCISLAKQTPLRSAYQLVERLQSRLELSPREKRLWKSAKDVAVLIAQVVIARCMVIPQCTGVGRGALYCCSRSLARALGPKLAPAAAALAAPAASAKHLHTLAAAVDAHFAQNNDTKMKPFVCEMYVRAITAGMNELERLKLKTEKESEARLMEQTLASWFVQLGSVLSVSDRIRCECTLTAFSVHPSLNMYERIKAAPVLPNAAEHLEPKLEGTSEFGSWAGDSRSQTNFVKTSETLNMKAMQQQANVLSTAILNEGETLGLSPELCQDIAVLLSGPRVKTLTWDMDRDQLIEKCRIYMERTHGGTRALTTELKYLNLDPQQFMHLPEEEDDEDNIYYGIEKGYEHLVQFQDPEEIWNDQDPERTESAQSTAEEVMTSRKKKKSKPLSSDDETDPLSLVAENKRNDKKKERPHSKERKKKECIDPLYVNEATEKKDKCKHKKEKPEKEKKDKKKRVRASKAESLASLVGLKVAAKSKSRNNTLVPFPSITDSDHDSQGKSSFTSLNSESHDVLFDGLFSMDELKSPEHPSQSNSRDIMKSNEINVSNGKVGIHHPLQSKKPCDEHNSTTKALEMLNMAPLNSVSEEVKKSIYKLIDYRRQRTVMEQANKSSAQPANVTADKAKDSFNRQKPVTILNNTLQSSESKFQNAISRPITPLQSCISPKAVAIPEIPKAFISKTHSEKLAELKREIALLLEKQKQPSTSNSVQSPVIQYAKKNINEPSKPFIPKPNFYSPRPAQHQNPIRMKDLVTVGQERYGPYEVTKPIYAQSRPSLPVHRPLITETAGENNYKKFLEEFHRSIDTPAVTKKEYTRKEIRPVSRVTPVMTKASFPEPPQRAKPIPQPKKPDNSLNTFSRLSYMHKNKQMDIKNKAVESSQNANVSRPSTGSKIDDFVWEHLRRSCPDQTNVNTSPKLSNVYAHNVRKSEITGQQNSQNTILSEILGKPENRLTQTCKRMSSQKPITKPNPVSEPHSNLSEKDQADLIKLLRQRSTLNAPASNALNLQTQSVVARPTPSPAHTEHKTDNTSVSSKIPSSKVINILSNAIIKPPIKTTTTSKPTSTITKNGTNIGVPEQPMKLENKPENRKDSVTRELESVMDAILAHKTPSRGPNALDIALNKSSFEKAFEDSLRRNHNVVIPEKQINTKSRDVSMKLPDTSIKSTTDPNCLNNRPSTIKGKSHLKTNYQKKEETLLPSEQIKVSEATKSGNVKNVPHKKCTNIEQPKRLNENLKKKISYMTPAENDPFISGIPNSDYDLIEELMDDDLRKEIGELSSDEESYNTVASNILNKSAKSMSDKRVSATYNKPLEIPSTSLTPINADSLSIKQTNCVRKTASKCIYENKLMLGQSNPQAIPVCSKTPEMCSKITATSSVAQLSSQIHGYSNISSFSGNHMPNNTNVYVTTAPQQPSVQNVVLIGSNLVYDGYAAVQSPIHTVTNIPTNAYLVNNIPNMSLYQTTQYAQPVINPVIIENTVTLPVINNLTCPSISIESNSANTLIHSDYNITNDVQVSKPLITVSHQNVMSYNSTKNESIITKVPECTVQQNNQFPLDNTECRKSSFKDPIELNQSKKDKTMQPKITKLSEQIILPASKAKCNSNVKEEIRSKRMANDTVLSYKQMYLDNASKMESKYNNPNKNIVHDNQFQLDYKTYSIPEDTLTDNSNKQEIKITDHTCTKNIERKVLCEVQEKQVTPEITEKVKYQTIDFEKPLKTSHDQERLKNKRMAIINRKISHYSEENPIPLSYSPISPVIQETKNEPNIDLKPEIFQEDGSTKAASVDITHKLEKLSSSIQDCTDNCKENKNNSTPYRRILLRSSNKLKNKTVSDSIISTKDVIKRVSVDSKKLEEKIVDEPTTQNDIVEPSGRKRISRRLRSKSVVLDEVPTEKHQKSKVRKVKLNVKRKIPLKTKQRKGTHLLQKVPKTDNSLAVEAFDIEAELLGSKIIKSQFSEPELNNSEIAANDSSTNIEVKASMLAAERDFDTAKKLEDEDKKGDYVPTSNQVQETEQSALADNAHEEINKINVEKKPEDVSDIIRNEIIKSITENVEVQKDTSELEEKNPKCQGVITCEYLESKNQDNSENLNVIPNLEVDDVYLGDKTIKPTYEMKTNTNALEVAKIPEAVVETTDLDAKETNSLASTPDNNSNVHVEDNKTIDSQSGTNKVDNIILADIPQSFKDSITIEPLPNQSSDHPLKKSVRIKLPNGRTFKATVSGQVNVDFDTLFQEPSIKSILINSMRCKKRYTLNIKQVTTVSKRDQKVLSTQIHQIKSRSESAEVIDTVNLLSDEDDDMQDENSSQELITEFGKYKMQKTNIDIFNKHQEKLKLKSVVVLEKLKHVKSTSINTVDLTSYEVKSFNEYDTLKSICDIESGEKSKDKPLSPKATEKHLKMADNVVEPLSINSNVNNDGLSDIVLIDDSSDDDGNKVSSTSIDADVKEHLNDLGIVDLTESKSKEDVTNVLNDLGIVDLTESKSKEDVTNVLKEKLLFELGISLDKPEIIKLKEQTNSSECNDCVILSPIAIHAIDLTEDTRISRPNLSLNEKIDNKDLCRKCYVKLVRCDELVKPIKSSQGDEIDLLEVEQIINPIQRSRSNSISILDDFPLICDDTSTLDRDRSSPVIEVFDVIASLDSFVAQKIVTLQPKIQITCDADWCKTKGTISKLTSNEITVPPLLLHENGLSKAVTNATIKCNADWSETKDVLHFLYQNKCKFLLPSTQPYKVANEPSKFTRVHSLTSLVLQRVNGNDLIHILTPVKDVKAIKRKLESSQILTTPKISRQTIMEEKLSEICNVSDTTDPDLTDISGTSCLTEDSLITGADDIKVTIKDLLIDCISSVVNQVTHSKKNITDIEVQETTDYFLKPASSNTDKMDEQFNLMLPDYVEDDNDAVQINTNKKLITDDTNMEIAINRVLEEEQEDKLTEIQSNITNDIFPIVLLRHEIISDYAVPNKERKSSAKLINDESVVCKASQIRNNDKAKQETIVHRSTDTELELENSDEFVSSHNYLITNNSRNKDFISEHVIPTILKNVTGPIDTITLKDLAKDTAATTLVSSNTEQNVGKAKFDKDKLELDSAKQPSDLSVASGTENILEKYLKLTGTEGPEVILKGIEYEDPEAGTCYVFPIIEDPDQSAQTGINLEPDRDEIIKLIQVATVKHLNEECNDDDIYNNYEIIIPSQTYTRHTERIRVLRNLKRKKDMSDARIQGKKYRKGKNIDYPKFTAAAINETMYTKEYKRLIDYYSTVKFSFSIPFHKDDVDVDGMIKNWPINKVNPNVGNEQIDVKGIFTDIEEESKVIKDPLEQTLAQEITTEYNESDYTPLNILETNFSMGFGERSDRVIQYSKIETNISKLSAATLSDVKPYQPYFTSERNSTDLNNITPEQNDERVKLMQHMRYITIREKVRTFFRKSAVELTHDFVDENKKSKYTDDFPFGLTSTDFFKRTTHEVIVNVVQVGQMAVSAAAQNPVTCDPRVTHVSNVSPSQCSAENSPGDDNQISIKTEYTELTTADITLPLVQEYAQHHQLTSTVDQDHLQSFEAVSNNCIKTEEDSQIKIELTEENSQEKMENDNYRQFTSAPENNNINNGLVYDYNGIHNNASMDLSSHYQIRSNTTADEAMNVQNQNNATMVSPMNGHSVYNTIVQDSINEQNIINTSTEDALNVQGVINVCVQNPTNGHSAFNITDQDKLSGQSIINTPGQELPVINSTERDPMNGQTVINTTLQDSMSVKTVISTPIQELTNGQSVISKIMEETMRGQNATNTTVANQINGKSVINTTLHDSPNGQSVINGTVQDAKNDNGGEVDIPNDTTKYSETKSREQIDKTDQLAHAMNAAGITTSNDTINTSNAEALVDIISQNAQSDVVTTSQITSNNYSKSTPINAMALQQALAQILPPSLNQATVSENGQPSAPPVLHIVQGANSQTVINKQNGTPLLHIVQNKSATNGIPSSQANTFGGLSLVDTGLQQGGNQLLHIVNTGNQKNNNAGQLLKRVNLLTNIANVQGGNEQKMVQFVCKSADGKSIQLNAPHQRSMVLRLQPIDPSTIQTAPKLPETQDVNANPANALNNKDASQQEIKSRSVYEENYAKFIQNGNDKPGQEKATSLPKFNQVFGKQVYQENKNEMNSDGVSEHTEGQQNENVHLEGMNDINSPPLLLRKTTPQTSQAQSNIVQQIKQTIAPMNIQTMHGGVIYTRQIPVNIGGGQTINLITVPSTELVDDNQKQQTDSKFVHQEGDHVIKIVPQSQANNLSSEENNNAQLNGSAETPPNPQPQPVLTQMRIKLPMLSKTPHMVSGARVVRPSFFQIQRNVIGGANQPVYQQLVLTTAPPLGQSIRVPAQTRPVKLPDSQSSPESQMSSSTLEQLREFDMVLEQVKERSTVHPGSSSFSRQSSVDTTDSTSVKSKSVTETTQVMYTTENNQTVTSYVNRKSTVTSASTSSFSRSPDSSGIVESPSSSTHNNIPSTSTSESTSSEAPPQPKPKKKKKSSSGSSNPAMKIPPAPPKPSSQKPLEDEQTTQRILYILAEYKEQVENSPDKDKPAPRRRNNLPPNTGSSKRKKSSSGSRRRDMSPIHGEDSCRTIGSEDSSCGTSLGECAECMESHSPEESPRKVVRKLTFEQETTHITQTRTTIPQRNVIVADGQTITVARGTTGKPATTVLMPANYLLPVSMVKGGQQIAIVTNRGPKLLVGGGEGGTGGTLLFQRLIGPGGLKPVLTRPGVRHIRLPTAALHNLQAFNIATHATTTQPADSTASPATAPAPPDLVDTRAMSSPWPDREAQEAKPDRGSSPEGSEPWNLPSSSIADDYGYEEIVRTDNMDRTVLDAIPDRYSPDMEAQRIFDKMFDVDSKKSMYDSRCGYDIDASDTDDRPYQVVQRRDGRHHRLTHVSAAALRHKYAILEHELRLQKSLSEECEDLGVDSPSAAELFPEAELFFAPSPVHEQTIGPCHTPQPTMLNQGIPQPDIDDQIATDHLLTHHDQELDINLDDVGEIVTVGEDGMATIPLDHEEFARSHPNTTFHTEPEEGEIPPFTISQSIKGRQITFHAGRGSGTVVMAPQTTVISQATVEASGTQNGQTVKFTDIDNMINAMPSPQPTNIPSVLVKDAGLTRFESILTDSRELHLTNTASAIVHSTGQGTQVIRRVRYDDRRESRYLIDDPDPMMEEKIDDNRDLESMAGDDASSPERHPELFWESNSASERSEGRRRLDFSSDSDKCCKSPYDEASTDSSFGNHTRLDSVIKAARTERSGSGSSEDHPPLRTYPPKRVHHVHHHDPERSLSGKTRAGERCMDIEGRRRASNRGVVKRGCHCCNGSPSPAPTKPKKSRQKKPSTDFTNT